ncbi:hypothetical protein [Peterkaempfera bronchialis]|uniref:hypothetical protein n=1 Tax=Peterkaempfera bronchialis TaxID=2126346 RepID=UPI003C2D4387
MSKSRLAAEGAVRASGRGIVWHTMGSGKTHAMMWQVAAALREGTDLTADWQRTLRSRASLLHEAGHLGLHGHGSVENLTALEAGLHALLSHAPEPEPPTGPPPVPDLPAILSGRNHAEDLPCCVQHLVTDDLPLPAGAAYDAETVSAALFVLSLAALVASGRLVLAVRVGPLPPGYVPPMWACACGPKRLAAPLVPRGPAAVSLSDVQSQGHRSGLSRGGVVLTA